MERFHPTDDSTFPTAYDGANGVNGVNAGFGGEMVQSVVESVVQSVFGGEEEL